MDLLAHGLWAAAGAETLRRFSPASPSAMTGIVALWIVPDIPQMIPLLIWAVSAGSLQSLYEYVVALPGAEPALPALVHTLVDHLHCIPHSAVVAGAATLLVWRVRPTWLVPLLGWWSHIVIDVFTHSADYYAVPVFYPFSSRGFDGVAWNSPSFMIVNYSMLAGVWLLLWIMHRRRMEKRNADRHIDSGRDDANA